MFSKMYTKKKTKQKTLIVQAIKKIRVTWISDIMQMKWRDCT